MILLLALSILSAPTEQVNRETFVSAGVERMAWTFVPERLAARAPLLVMMPTANMDGRPLVEHWKDLASKEGIILAGLDPADRMSWRISTEGPEHLRDLVEYMKQRYPVDARRVYLFGHSGGGYWALSLGVMQTEYLAAVAGLGGGYVGGGYDRLAEEAPRKIPIALWGGPRGEFATVEQLRNMRAKLQALGFKTVLTELTLDPPDYFRHSADINAAVWQFLRQHELQSDPKYKEYSQYTRRPK